MERAVVVLGRDIGRTIGRVSWSLLYVALSRVKKLKHVKFFPHGRRDSVDCFKYLTKLKPSEKLRKWTDAFKSGYWDGSIVKSNQLRRSAAIEAKLSQQGRDETLSLKNDILKGYLGGLGHGSLYALLRKPLQHKLNDHMVRKRGWKPTDDVADIELPTKRRCRRLPKNSSSRIRKNLQGKIQNQNPVAISKVVEKKRKAQLLISAPPRRSKRLREKASGCILDGVSKHNEASIRFPKKKMTNQSSDNISYFKDLSKAKPLTIEQLILAEEEEIKSHSYKEVKVNIEGFGEKTTTYNCGKGDCFFIAIQQGLRLLRMVEFNKDEMRKNLSLWFQDDGNAAAITSLHSAQPYDIIPHLHVVGGVAPRGGWRRYLRGRDWKFWGRRIARKGTWVGAIELEAMNDLLLNAGYDVRVNIYDSRSRRLFGEDCNIPGQLVIILYLSNAHFEVLYPITRCP